MPDCFWRHYHTFGIRADCRNKKNPATGMSQDSGKVICEEWFFNILLNQPHLNIHRAAEPINSDIFCHLTNNIRISASSIVTREFSKNQLSGIFSHYSTLLRIRSQIHNQINKRRDITCRSEKTAPILFENICQFPSVETRNNCTTCRHYRQHLARHGCATQTRFTTHHTHISKTVYQRDPFYRLKREKSHIIYTIIFYSLLERTFQPSCTKN